MSGWSLKRKSLMWLSFASLMGLTLMFQNCGQGFSAARLDDSLSLESQSSLNGDLRLKLTDSDRLQFGDNLYFSLETGSQNSGTTYAWYKKPSKEESFVLVGTSRQLKMTIFNAGLNNQGIYMVMSGQVSSNEVTVKLTDSSGLEIVQSPTVAEVTLSKSSISTDPYLSARYNVTYGAIMNYNLQEHIATVQTAFPGLQNSSTPIRIVIAEGMKIGSMSTDKPAFTTGEYSYSSEVQIVNRGKIQGAGGKGGQGRIDGVYSASSKNAAWIAQVDGAAGGVAIELTTSVTIDNRQGKIWAGGGGGGGGASGSISIAPSVQGAWTAFGGDGGGGAGLGYSSGGEGLRIGFPGWGIWYAAPGPGFAGTEESGGDGGPAGKVSGNGPTLSGTPGAKGGYPGMPGDNGFGKGGAAGFAVKTGGHVLNWINEQQGEVLGQM